MVFVISADRKPLDMCSEVRARILLDKGRAVVFRHFPFVILLKNTWSFATKTDEYRLKIDPGAKFAGLAILREDNGQVVWAAEIQHRGWKIKKDLDRRRGFRRGRRTRKTRYREARFNNRTKPKGWLPPSLMHRPLTVYTWAKRLMKYCPIKHISVESSKFDTQKFENPDIEGVEYQQGELAGYELREYIMEKYKRLCIYCKNPARIPNVEHNIPKSRGGTDRLKNLVLSCKKCNMEKGSRTAEEYFEFLRKCEEKKLNRELTELEAWRFSVEGLVRPEFMKAIAVNNSIRNKLFEMLKSIGIPLEFSYGYVTKKNRQELQLDKAHWIDAACVGTQRQPDKESIDKIKPFQIVCKGRGTRQRVQVYGSYKLDKKGKPIIPKSKKGFPAVAPGMPCSKPKSGNEFFGFMSGDYVKARAKQGDKTGRLSVRKTGWFTLRTRDKKTYSVSYKNCRVIQRNDGYEYLT